MTTQSSSSKPTIFSCFPQQILTDVWAEWFSMISSRNSSDRRFREKSFSLCDLWWLQCALCKGSQYLKSGRQRLCSSFSKQTVTFIFEVAYTGSMSKLAGNKCIRLIEQLSMSPFIVIYSSVAEIFLSTFSLKKTVPLAYFKTSSFLQLFISSDDISGNNATENSLKYGVTIRDLLFYLSLCHPIRCDLNRKEEFQSRVPFQRAGCAWRVESKKEL